MEKEQGITLVTVIMMVIVIGVIASLSVITSKDVLKRAKENAQENNKAAVEAVVLKYASDSTFAGYLTPANKNLPGINNPSFEYAYVDENGDTVTEEKNVGEDWYLLLQEHLEEMGVSYEKENYLVNYKENVVIALNDIGNVFKELEMYGYHFDSQNHENTNTEEDELP